MRLIERYYLKSFIKLFLILSVGLSVILSLLDLIEKLGEFMTHLSTEEIILYPIYNFPKYFSYLMPLSGLLAGLFTMGQASRRKEIVAIMAGGGRLKKLLMPFVVTGVILSILGFYLSEFVVPAFTKMAKDIKKTTSKTVKPLFWEGVIWFKAKDGSIVRMDLYIPEKNLTKGISIFKIKAGILKERIEAEEAVYEKGVWILKNVRTYDIETGITKKLDALSYPYIESPQSLRAELKQPEEMGVVELMKYVSKLTKAGIGNVRLVVDMHAKISYPLINLFMLMMAVSFSVRRGLGGFLAGAIGLLISFLYWLGFTMAISFGYAGILPPFIAAWIIPLIFSAAAVYLFHTIPE